MPLEIIIQWAKTLVLYAVLMSVWILAYLSAGLLNFLGTFASLWFLPAGVTLAIVATVPTRFVTAPLAANLALAVPQLCEFLGVPFTNILDPIIHAARLYIIYGGVGLILRLSFKIYFPVSSLYEAVIVVSLTILAALLGAITGVSAHVLMGNFPVTVAQDIFVSWFVGDAIGALIVPPLLAPVLRLVSGHGLEDQNLPKRIDFLIQAITIPALLYFVFGFPLTKAYLGSFWYLILLPPLAFAMMGGITSAALATVITTFLTPLTAHYTGYDGRIVEIQFLILFSSVVSLVLGSAVSDQRKAFAEVKASELRLEQQVEDRTRELLEAYRFQQHLIRSVGHDLRQPMQSMSLMLEGVARLLQDSPALPHIQSARDINCTTSELIERILDYAKRDVGKVEAKNELTSMADIFERLRSTFAAEAEAKDIKLSFSGEEIYLETDELLLWEGLANLLQNALRLSGRGEKVEVFASRLAGRVNVGVVDSATSNVKLAGEAGFGMLILFQLADLLDAKLIREPNRFHLRFESPDIELAGGNLIGESE